MAGRTKVSTPGGAEKAAVLREFRRLPNVGPATAGDLYDLGLRSIQDIARSDPDDLYERLCAHQGTQVDRCALYVFRALVYLSKTKTPDPEKVVWWAWKDASPPSKSRKQARS